MSPGETHVLFSGRELLKMSDPHFPHSKVILTYLILILFSVPSTPRMMQMTMTRGMTPNGSYRMMTMERMKMKKGMDMNMNQYPAPAQSYSAPQASPEKVVVVKVQPMMMQPKMEDCIVPVDICGGNMMMPMMMYGGGGGDR